MIVIGEIVTVALFFVVIAITAVVFFGWIVFTVIRAIIGGLMSLFMPRRPVVTSNTVRCMTQGCGALNPPEARFCRRCGRGLPAAQRVQVRRAAVW